MNCPKCYEPLRIADRQGIEIDYCPEYRGVWLDRGELDKAVSVSHSTFDFPAPFLQMSEHIEQGKIP